MARAKAVVCAAGGDHIFKPRSVGEGMEEPGMHLE